MLSGWIRISIRAAGMSNSQRASITSSPLFIRVAESMVILGPMDQVGWVRACSRVTWLRSGVVRKGPPEPVSSRRRTSCWRWPRSDWWIALCSLSTGSTEAPCRRAASMQRLPAMTSGSLLATATVTPRRMARSVGLNPTAPTIAVSTTSASGWPATASAPASPHSSSGSGVRPRWLSRARSRSRVASSRTETTAGSKRSICSARRSTLPPAARATTLKCSGKSATTERALAPTEPVEPRIASPLIRPCCR